MYHSMPFTYVEHHLFTCDVEIDKHPAEFSLAIDL